MDRRRYVPTSSSDFEQKKRGRDNEVRALAALRDSRVPMPEWIRAVRGANHKEDYFEHTDIVIETHDIGIIRVQIKSSQKGRDEFRRRYPELLGQFIVVVINQRVSPAWIRSEIFDSALALRANILRIERERKEDEMLIAGLLQAQHPRRIASIQEVSSRSKDRVYWDFVVVFKDGQSCELRIVSRQVSKNVFRKLRESGQKKALVHLKRKPSQATLVALRDRVYSELHRVRKRLKNAREEYEKP